VHLSIVISTYNRENNIIEIINLFNKQINFPKKNFEIIICDSNSKKRLSIINYIKQFKDLKIKYYNCLVNHQAYKRNYGLKKSCGQYIVFIDDDCFPEINFLYKYFNYFKLNKKKIIYCGLVKYNIFPNIKSFIHYRQSRQISLNSFNKNNIPAKNFVSMNMGLIKNNFYNKKNVFNNKFRYYGFEDFEFAYRAIMKSYKIILINPLVIHRDARTFLQFLLKYNYLGEYGIIDITKINIKAAQQSIFYKIENNFFISLFLTIPKINIFLKKIQEILILIEKKNLFYFSIIYKFAILVAFLRGVSLRQIKIKKGYKTIENSWYK
jgi:glycosyltransferase involved in cell wall biosynthesis